MIPKNPTGYSVSRFIIFFTALLFIYSFPVFAQSTKTPPKLLKSINAFYASIENADAEARIDLLADSILMMPNHWTIMRGKETVSRSFRNAAQSVFKLKDRKQIRISVSGNLAYTVNSFYYTYRAKGAPEQWHKTKNVHIWQRTPIITGNSLWISGIATFL